MHNFASSGAKARLRPSETRKKMTKQNLGSNHFLRPKLSYAHYCTALRHPAFPLPRKAHHNSQAQGQACSDRQLPTEEQAESGSSRARPP